MVKTVLQERESKSLKYKSSVPSFNVLIKTCIAFANTSGGRIIIGVDDATHEVIGINDKDRSAIYDDFQNSLYDSTQPTLFAQIYEKNYGQKSVLIIDIPMSPKKPYFIKAKGVSEGTYVHVGTSTRKANQEHISDLIRDAQRIPYDEEIIEVSTKQLSKELLKDYYETRISTKRLLADKIIARQSANMEQLASTVAGLLSFNTLPHQFISEALIKCTRFAGIGGRNIVRTKM